MKTTKDVVIENRATLADDVQLLMLNAFLTEAQVMAIRNELNKMLARGVVYNAYFPGASFTIEPTGE